MRVWVVVEHDWHEYQGLHGVFSSAELAKKYVGSKAASDRDYFAIHERELDSEEL